MFNTNKEKYSHEFSLGPLLSKCLNLLLLISEVLSLGFLLQSSDITTVNCRQKQITLQGDR